MDTPTPPGERAGAVQTAPGVLCPVCKVPLVGRQKAACSDAHRARIWRERRAQVAEEGRQARDQALVALLDQAEGFHQQTAEALQRVRRRLEECSVQGSTVKENAPGRSRGALEEQKRRA